MDFTSKYGVFLQISQQNQSNEPYCQLLAPSVNVAMCILPFCGGAALPMMLNFNILLYSVQTDVIAYFITLYIHTHMGLRCNSIFHYTICTHIYEIIVSWWFLLLLVTASHTSQMSLQAIFFQASQPASEQWLRSTPGG